jgi:hypothetical protein
MALRFEQPFESDPLTGQTTARQSSSCGTITVTAEDDGGNGGDNGDTQPPDNGGTQPGDGDGGLPIPGGTTGLAAGAGGLVLLVVLLSSL